MTQPAVSIDAEAGTREAATLMKEAGVGMLPVTSGQRCIGVVTDRDLVVRGLAQDRLDRPIRELMTAQPVCMSKEEEVEEAMRIMKMSRWGASL